MGGQQFLTKEGRHVPALTAEEMREVDRVAVEGFGLGILQMIENAGRNLAHHVVQMLGRSGVYAEDCRRDTIAALAGAGSNGGLTQLCNHHAAQVLSLDVPSGLDATSGDAPGDAVRPDLTLTLALPKTGLWEFPGELYLADIGIRPEVYLPLSLSVGSLFGEKYWLRLYPSAWSVQSG
jgi:NAD(P)H-hydrate repair Nnr-like enzyme with NAD(P)H-hydrate epimerase domain